LLLLGLGAVVIGAGIGLRDAWAPDEPRFVLIARDMLASGNWLFPTRGGELYADKPPLFFWVMAAAMGAIGSMKLAFLVPSLIASLVTLGLVHDIARRLWGGRAGLVAGLLLLLTLQFTQHAKAAHIDAMLCMWTTLSLYGLVRHLLLGPSWGWYTIAWLAAGFGVITKGVGFLALFALLPYAYARARDWPGVVRGGGWRWIAGAGAMLLPIAAWLVPMLYEVQSSGSPALAAWRDDLLLRQTFHRYANAIGHVHGWWYYLAGVIPLFWLPGTALLPWLVPAWTRDLKARDARTLILLGLTAAIVVFFTLSPGKRGVYLLPAVPVFALAAARMFATCSRDGRCASLASRWRLSPRSSSSGSPRGWSSRAPSASRRSRTTTASARRRWPRASVCSPRSRCSSESGADTLLSALPSPVSGCSAASGSIRR
jgi:4-amino-4-deoxy-L-arabinose transferase-like glycosyltransferase